jgi:tetratricopeptide (TPR) repeat protein
MLSRRAGFSGQALMDIDPTKQPADSAQAEPAPAANAPPVSSRDQLSALLAAGKLDEAQTYFDQLPKNVEKTGWYLLAGLRLAAHRSDQPAIIDFAARLRTTLPANPRGYVVGIATLTQAERLDEAQAVATLATQRFPDAPWAWREAASVARQRRDVAAEMDSWSQLLKIAPVARNDVFDAVAASRAAGRPDLALSFLDQSVGPLSDTPDNVEAAAKRAATNMQFLQAAELWEQLCLHNPKEPSYGINAANAMIRQRQGRERRVPAALTRLESVQQNCPTCIEAFTTALTILRDVHEYDSAETLASQWVSRFGNNTIFILERARIAETRGAFADALAQLEAFRQRAAPRPLIEAATIRILSRMGRMDDAQAAYARAIELFPGNLDLLSEHARLATQEGNLQEAADRWANVARIFPDLPRVQNAHRLAINALAAEGLVDLPRPAGEKPDLLDQFESLGGTFLGCEFGMAQQHYKAGSVSLLRWATLGIPVLLDLLTHRFEGLGAPETTELGTVRVSADREEYLINDTRYKFGSHTFIRVQEVPPDKALAQGRRRFSFLAGKMLEDLSNARRIYVLKHPAPLDLAQLETLHGALRAYGDNALLCVTKPDAENAAGSIREIRRGLFAGYMSRFMGETALSDSAIDHAAWRALCEETAALWNALRAAEAALPAVAPQMSAPGVAAPIVAPAPGGDDRPKGLFGLARKLFGRGTS